MFIYCNRNKINGFQYALLFKLFKVPLTLLRMPLKLYAEVDYSYDYVSDVTEVFTV